MATLDELKQAYSDNANSISELGKKGRSLATKIIALRSDRGKTVRDSSDYNNLTDKIQTLASEAAQINIDLGVLNRAQLSLAKQIKTMENN